MIVSVWLEPFIEYSVGVYGGTIAHITPLLFTRVWFFTLWLASFELVRWMFSVDTFHTCSDFVRVLEIFSSQDLAVQQV